MRYDDEASALIIDDDFALPAKFFISEHNEYPMPTMADPGKVYVHDTRVFRCMFENRWGLSIIWGSMTYSDNHNHPHGDWRGGPPPEFVEEPNAVEVGIIMPDEHTRPAVIINMEDLPHWKGPTEIPEHTYELWGDPIGWVTAEGLRFLVGYVSRLDSHTYPQLEDGPYLNRDDDGPYSISFEVREEVTNGKEPE
jgi:hypothetical protein